jgi:hypothetical protein
MVIDDTGEIVGGYAIGADKDEITDVIGIKIHPPMNEIFKGEGPSLHPEPEDRTLAF